MPIFRSNKTPLLRLVLLLIVLVGPLAITAFLVPNPPLRRWSIYLAMVSVGLVGYLIGFRLTQRARSTSLVASWSGKWDPALLGEYLDADEQSAFARLVGSRRWEFAAVPSVRKSGITIELKGKGASDKDLASLASLRTVHVLVLSDCPVTDAGICHLARLDSLECLVLSRTKVTDAGLEQIKSLTGLKTLDVDETSISDSALRATGLLDKKFSLDQVEREARAERIAAPRDAVGASLDIVDINRRLAAMRPDACLPDLAVSLNNLGWGRKSPQAVDALRESVDINRQLVATRTEDHRPALYNSLSNLGDLLEKSGRYEEALAATEEALDVFRRLPATAPSTDSALALQRLGGLYCKADRQEEAASAIRESVEVFRLRVAAAPDALMLHSWFVSSLNDLGTCLCALGRNEEALAAVNEAVDVSRRLAGKWPGSADLMTSLDLQSRILTELGRQEEADAAKKEATTFNEAKRHR